MQSPGGITMRKWIMLTLCALAISLPAGAIAADPELVKAAQLDLIQLGYDPGNIQGEMSTETIVAISKFQAEHNMDVTGEVTPQLIGALRAAKNQGAQTGASPGAAPAAAPQLTLEQRQQQCLQEKYAAAQERNKKKRGMMRLLSAVSRTSGMAGGDLGHDISRATGMAYGASATAQDLEQAGKDLGLTPDEMEECRNPP